jgi:tRNA threonylcarbamoyladenosine biosynthesis protein TsaE
VLYLHGDLGAGKSTLARALLRALGVRGAIRSPTYTLIERYPLAVGQGGATEEAVHLDLYRIAAAAELDFLGLDDLAAQAVLWLVEWPERGGHALPPADLHVRLAIAGEGREAVLEPQSPSGVGWLERFARV